MLHCSFPDFVGSIVVMWENIIVFRKYTKIPRNYRTSCRQLILKQFRKKCICVILAIFLSIVYTYLFKNSFRLSMGDTFKHEGRIKNF